MPGFHGRGESRVLFYPKTMDKNQPIVDVSPEGIELENHYWIDANRINSKEKLVEWIHHLCQKTWITPEHIRQIIDGAAQLNGWKIYVNA